jgi:hypothetical protein
VHRDVGVDAGRHLAEHLQQRVVAEGQRGVGLLPGEQRRVRLGVEVVPGQPVPLERAAGGGLVERGQPARHRLAVVRGVVHVHVTAELGLLPPADEGVVETVLALGVEGQRQLVELAGAVVVVDEGDDVDRRFGGRAGLHPPQAPDVGDVERPSLAAEPARALDEGLQGVEGSGHGALPSSVGRANRNQ